MIICINSAKSNLSGQQILSDLGLTVGFLLLRHSVVCTVVLSSFYILIGMYFEMIHR